jgi:AAA+ superfamily predicted ATPase
MCQNLRALDSDDKEVGIVDVEKYIKDAKISLPLATDGTLKKILTADEELDELVGLDSVKRMVRKIRAYAKRNKDLANFNVHMCFYGNPGTGKTEVARIISRILYDAGVLEEAKMIETDAHGLIGRFVGETAPKTEAKIQDSMGGVLFIDEAYSLTDASSNGNSGTSYGDEAIAVLLKRMEDSRGRFCVVLAGYQKEMQMMLSSNPGLESRIQFTLEFPDYTREELAQILVRFATKRGYVVEDSALERLLDVTEYYRGLPNFANARTVRNILDQVVMNQNLRTEDDVDNYIIVLSDVEDYIMDEKITLGISKKKTIGFC